MGPLILSDGYTLDAALPPRGRLPGVVIRYRPALPEAVFCYQAAPAATGPQRMKAVVDLLAGDGTPARPQHLLGWDVADGHGVEVPVSAETLRRVPHRVLLEIVNVVTGYDEAADAKN